VFFVIAPAHGQNDGKRDLALAEIISDTLPE